MNTLLIAAAATVLVTVAVALIRVVRGPSTADCAMAAQMLGTGGIAALLLLAVAMGTDGALDVALVLALLSPFASVALARSCDGPDDRVDASAESPVPKADDGPIVDRFRSRGEL